MCGSDAAFVSNYLPLSVSNSDFLNIFLCKFLRVVYMSVSGGLYMSVWSSSFSVSQVIVDGCQH